MDSRLNFPRVDSHVRILIVDDHPNTANMLARAISRLGPNVEVISATSGLEAIKHVKDKAADILITDMMMPEMTGIELIEMLNDQPSMSPSVCYLLTAHDSTSVREIAKRLNVRDVIAKPAHPERVCQIISNTISELEQTQSATIEPVSYKEPNTEIGTESKLEDIVITSLLWDVAKKFQTQADIKNQLLVVGNAEQNLIVRGSAVQLRQALRNLVWSAIQNTPKGGTVTLSSKNESNMVKILVRDTGYGISPSDLPKILDDSELEQSNDIEDNDAADQTLAIVNLIAKRHNGAIAVESEPGKGSCFILSLPLFQMKESTQVE